MSLPAEDTDKPVWATFTDELQTNIKVLWKTACIYSYVCVRVRVSVCVRGREREKEMQVDIESIHDVLSVVASLSCMSTCKSG